LTCGCPGNTVVTCNLFGSKLSSNLNLEFSRGLIVTRDRLKRGKLHTNNISQCCTLEIETIFDKKCRSWVKLEGTWNHVSYDVACLEAVLRYGIVLGTVLNIVAT
jgi:hypothetical protein